MNRKEIKLLTDHHEYLASKLFCRGYLLTDDASVDPDAYPFYGKWSVRAVGCFTLYAHPLLSVHIAEEDGLIAGFLGSAFDPIDGETDEIAILARLLKNYSDKEKFYAVIHQLTGVYNLFVLDGDELVVLHDPTCLRSVFYSVGQERRYVSSHSNLIGDLLGLEEDPFVTRLKRQRTFYYFGNQLPGNITRFREVRMLIGNHLYRYDSEKETVERYYYPHSLALSMEEITDRLISVLQNTMRLIAEKWKRPAISLTGGCDSKTTLAAASGIYDKFLYFSYDSQPNERPDADAAKVICSALGLEHHYYHIPYEDDAFEDIEGIRSILLWNGGDVRPNNENDVRKRAFFDQKDDFDVDVKSWSSEVGRCRYTKRYGDIRFGDKPTPRKCTTFYKFLTNHKIICEVDKIFKDYLDKFFQQAQDRPIPWQDQFYWEWLWSTRDGLALTAEFSFSDETVVPYNNRVILELLLSVPEKERSKDTVYTLIRQKLDPRIDRATEAIVDVNHTKKRMLMERLYYRVNNLLPY